MRRKIAKAKRREILKRAEIVKEGWVREPGWKRKECCYNTEVTCNGWDIFAPEYDELASYKAILECLEFAEETPHDEYVAKLREIGLMKEEPSDIS